ncbi:3-deoxy-8-phosphooctulonate synthase [Sphingomonas humi]|uniref:2-dehydro-3-deoxyphosphooctonate aldolase n=1 Tax=Sphingomonas humi TaxID=335630 RepID=A0ABP7S2F7_9SPHN
MSAYNLLGRAVGLDRKLFLIAGPCAIESEALCLRVADELARLAAKFDMLIIFKSSFDKANRTSSTSFRGVGLNQGLAILDKVRRETGLPILTDVHTPEQVRAASDVVDVLQTPAFLARQTDLIEAAAASGRPVNYKKAQFMAPADVKPMIAKARAAAAAAGLADPLFMVCERGTSFGYNNLVVDMRSLVLMRDAGCPVVFDATHSVQLPGGMGDRSGGQREFVHPLARAAVAVGVSGLFMECHPDPDQALSDGPNAVPLAQMEGIVSDLLRLQQAAAGA